jgi:hypothetical protein
MIRRCSWCRDIIGNVAPAGDDRETHGICHECLRRALREVAALSDAQNEMRPEPANGAA